MTSAIVGLGARWCAREVDTAYSDGTHINMKVKFSSVDGFMLPASLIADIKVPSATLAASAEFENYSFAFGSTRG